MTVNVIGLRPGALDGARSFAGEAPVRQSSGGARVEEAVHEVTRSAIFDFNGDGKIERSNPLYGGDGTLLGFDIPSPPPPRARQIAASRPTTPVDVDHAHRAYKRSSPPEKPAHTEAPKAQVA